MIEAGDIRNGVTIEIDGNVFVVVSFLHVKPGKGSAFVRTKIKNVMTGAVLERTFNPSEKFTRAVIETKEMQYLYNDGELYTFMDTETYEQIPFSKDVVEEALPFMIEEMVAKVKFYKGKAFSVEPPTFVVLKIVDTEPGVRGDTATNASKPAILETGHQVFVPLFVNNGESVRVDTRTGEYMERA